MPSQPSHGPSDAAVEAARRVGPFQFLSEQEQVTPLRTEQARDVLSAAHDPFLGLDRSVCLRDVVQWFRSEAMPEGASEPPSAYLLATVEAFEREFGGLG